MKVEIPVEIPGDDFLEKRLTRYDKWLAKGLISHSSRVIPVTESFSPEQWVLPSAQALAIIKGAASIAVQDCECRSHYKRCDHPLEVCLVFNDVADRTVARGEARQVSVDEAAGILRTANESGLVHLSLYMPDHEVYALCSCCACCCHDLQIVKRYGRPDLMVRSEYLAVTLEADCLVCGDCVDRCPFDARQILRDALVFSEDRCLGCGLCVGGCPGGAISMAARGSRSSG